ncbi:MAG: bifunctional chorismate-binding protein/class IV aminotransferase [Pseudobdellovibrio sp.]
MKPLICFYKEDLFLYSEKYSLLNIKSNENPLDFLKQVQSHYFNKIKILKINFETFHKEVVNKDNTNYITTPNIQVFIVEEYLLLTEKDLIIKLEKICNTIHLKKSYDVLFKPVVSEKSYYEKITDIRADISQGRFYQINLTTPFIATKPENYDALSFFHYLNKKTQARYKAYLPIEDNPILCFSPEMFISKQGSLIKTQPIKGTLLDGDDMTQLEDSPKEHAELSMIVDLLRNDLNSLHCKEIKDFSKVNFHRELMHLAYTTHTYSEIEINSSLRLPDILQKVFPGGSISGCPKKESLIKINEIEDYNRDFYTGSIGWWYEDDFCLNIAIRSLSEDNKNLYYFTGGGIVYDSHPAHEWRELITKSGFLKDSFVANKNFILDTLEFDGYHFTYLDEHIERTYLAYTHKKKQYALKDVKAIYQSLESSLKKTLQKPHKVRLTFMDNVQNVIIDFDELTPLREPIKLQLKPYNPKGCEFKTTQRKHWDQLLQTKKTEADDILIYNTENKIIETSIFNIVVIMNDVAYTPPLSDGCLRGTFREHYLKKGYITLHGQKYPFKEKSLYVSDLILGQLYVVNSVRGIIKGLVID